MARRCYEAVLEGAPGLDLCRADALCGLGIGYAESDPPDGAKSRETFERVLRELSDVTPAALMASVFTGSPAPDPPDREQALRAFRGLERQYPLAGVRAWARLYAGIEQLALGRASDAKTDWERLLADGPGDDPRATRLAKLFLGTIDEKTFLAELEKTDATLRNDDLYHVGRWFEARGMPDRAKEWFRRSLDASKDDDWPAPLARKKVE
jgi:tetratricopeptide (TPR) repeat protein